MDKEVEDEDKKDEDKDDNEEEKKDDDQVDQKKDEEEKKEDEPEKKNDQEKKSDGSPADILMDLMAQNNKEDFGDSNEMTKDTDADTTQTGLSVTDASEGKYVLLDRLFKFIRTEEIPLNPVLSGYFFRLVNLLIMRKQKQLVPYIFGDDSDVIDCLLRHVYQKSVSEVLNKLLNILGINFDEEMVAKIQEKKQKILNELIEKLGNKECDEEESMNITMILSDIMEQKNFFSIISKKQNLTKLCEISFSKECPLTSRTTTLQLLTKFVQQFSDRVKSNFNDDSGSMTDGGDDDIIIDDSNNDENDEAKKKSDQVVYDVLESFVMPITNLLQTEDLGTTRVSSYQDKEFKNLGPLKLRAIELLS